MLGNILHRSNERLKKLYFTRGKELYLYESALPFIFSKFTINLSV